MKYNTDNQIRVFNIKDEPWFAASDACEILGLTNVTNALRGIDIDDITTNKVIDTIGRKQDIYVVSESGLYWLIFKSKKEEAKNFKKWVFKEVLPSIRKTGSYSIPKSLSKKSTEARNVLTGAWKECGVNKPEEYRNLTLEEYRQLQFEKGKRKKDFNREELLLLHALESLESLNLYYNPVEGYIECKNSLKGSAKKVTDVKHKALED